MPIDSTAFVGVTPLTTVVNAGLVTEIDPQSCHLRVNRA